jgi:ABC-type multidrug transport system fused ATPase/permease subunit
MFPASDDLLKAALGLFLFFGAGAALARWAAETTSYSLRARMEESIRLETARALLDTDWSRFISLRQGDITKALIAEGMHISWGTYAFIAALGSALITVMYFVTALAISIEMTAITVSFSSVGILAYVLAWNWVKQFSDRLSNLTSELGERVGDIFGNLKFVRSTGATQAAESHASRVFGEYRKVYFYSQASMPALRTIFEVAAVIFLVAFLYWSLLVARQPAAPVLVFLVVFYRLVPRVIAVQDGLFASATYLSWYRSWKERLDFIRAHPRRATAVQHRALTAASNFNA